MTLRASASPAGAARLLRNAASHPTSHKQHRDTRLATAPWRTDPPSLTVPRACSCLCEHPGVTAHAIRVRPAEEGDRRSLARLFAAVAEERDGIAAEPPIDIDQRAANFDLDRTLVALAAGEEVVGLIFVIESSFGFGEIGMMVAANWRGRGVGTALVAAAIEWARTRGLHKLTLSVFPHNKAAIALYQKFRFVEEGRLTQQIRRANGELWDLIEMGLML
jgi:RimJ/RimL family protein N-acetyltransferase